MDHHQVQGGEDKFFKFKEEFGSSPAMAPTINGCSMADLIMQSIKKQVEPQLTDMHELLLGALARITCLEKELNNYKVDRSIPRPPSTSTSSSQLCRHWLKRRCTWKDKCRFSHGSDADSEGSSAVVDAGDLEEVEMLSKAAKVELPKDKQVPSSSSLSSCEVTNPMHSSEIVNCLLNSKLPGSAQSHTGVHIATSLLEDVLSSVVARVPPAVKSPRKLAAPQVGPLAHISKDELWMDKMEAAVDKLDAKYTSKYSPQKEGTFIHSAEVAIPRVDFSKVKPHLHRNLPKPSPYPVYSCSPDPKFYTDCYMLKHRADHQGCGGGCKPLFDIVNASPFGSLPGFATNLGIVPIPQAPIGGYIYKGGTGDETTWQLYAEAVYI